MTKSSEFQPGWLHEQLQSAHQTFNELPQWVMDQVNREKASSSKSDELRQAIMNLQGVRECSRGDEIYNQGHRDARHAAAEISAEYVAPLEAESAHWKSEAERISKDLGEFARDLNRQLYKKHLELTEARQRAEQAELSCQSKQDAIDTLMAEAKAASERAEQAEAEVGRLRELVRSAYTEGFYDGESHGSIDWKYPPVNAAWLFSESRESTGRTAPPELLEWRDKWRESAIKDQPDDFTDEQIAEFDSREALEATDAKEPE